MAAAIERPDTADSIDPGRRLIRLDEGGLSLGEKLATQMRHLVWRTPLHRLRLRGKFPLKLVATPEDPIPGDRTRGTALLEGRVLYHDEEIALADLDFGALVASQGFIDYLQGFEWLRDLAAAADREEAVPVAEKLMRNWLQSWAGKVSERSWRADIWG
ncbi:MAG: heparinase, partial [Sphingomonadales bacterium]|nr:heparinase [Sphingomonadales bacterium]